MLKIILIHNPKWDYVSTVNSYNYSLKKYSKNEIIMITNEEECFKISEDLIKEVDIICISYCSWVWFQNRTSIFHYYKNINNKLKFVMFLQDEYEYHKQKKQLIC